MKIQTKQSSYTLISGLGILVNSEIDGEFQSLYPSSTEVNEQKLIESLRTDLSDEEIETHISNCRNLVLNITEDCNFRCKYCAYSGIYDNIRIHSPKKMDLITAKNAVDMFFRNLDNKNRRLKINSISIGFYGGEALLEFSLIKDIIEYARDRLAEKKLDNVFELQFHLSTNGYLLNNKEVLDFLIGNNIGIDISIDGPEEEHNKFRVTKDREKTWESIWENLDYIYNKFPDYYSKKVNFLVTLHPQHVFENIDRFFLENPERFDIKKLIINNLSQIFLKEPYKKKWFSRKLFQTSRLKTIKSSVRLDSKFSLNRITSGSTFTAMCFPGEVKFFVSSDGNIHICERIKMDLPIGNVYDGLDYTVIKKIQRLWNEEIIRNRCWECPAVSFCHFCLAHCEDKDRIRLECNFEKSYRDVLSNYLAYKENEKIDANSKTEGEGNSIKEYLRRL
jgi:uncharacterized protein